MNLLGLVWANLFRKPVRTVLTMLSIVVSFLLFCLLQALLFAFDGGAFVSGADRLMVGGKYSQIDNLPYNQKHQILNVEGVVDITHSSWFGGRLPGSKKFLCQVSG